LDIGFDRDGLSKPDENGRVPLQLGFTQVDQEGNPVFIARKLKPQDRLLLTLYDLTEEEVPSSPVTDLSFKISFQKARTKSPDSPVAETMYEHFKIYPGPLSPGYSTVFEGEFPNWNIHRPETGAPAYPGNQCVPGDPQPPRKSFVLELEGYFYFTLLLRVGWVDGGSHVKHFLVDPEIILSNNGPLDPDEQL
jgi:hypothetical protein